MPINLSEYPGDKPPTIAMPGVIDKLCQALQLGVTYASAARLAGMSRRTLHRSLLRGQAAADKAEDGELLDEVDAWWAEVHQHVSLARARAEFDMVASIRRAGIGREVQVVVGHDDRGLPVTRTEHIGGDWRATGFILERRFPEHYSRQSYGSPPEIPQPAVVDITPDADAQVDLSKLSRDELRQLEALLDRAGDATR